MKGYYSQLNKLYITLACWDMYLEWLEDIYWQDMAMSWQGTFQSETYTKTHSNKCKLSTMKQIFKRICGRWSLVLFLYEGLNLLVTLILLDPTSIIQLQFVLTSLSLIDALYHFLLVVREWAISFALPRTEGWFMATNVTMQRRIMVGHIL